MIYMVSLCSFFQKYQLSDKGKPHVAFSALVVWERRFSIAIECLLFGEVRGGGRVGDRT